VSLESSLRGVAHLASSNAVGAAALVRNKNASSTKHGVVMEFYGLPPIGQKQRRPMDGAQFHSPWVGKTGGELKKKTANQRPSKTKLTHWQAGGSGWPSDGGQPHLSRGGAGHTDFCLADEFERGERDPLRPRRKQPPFLQFSGRLIDWRPRRRPQQQQDRLPRNLRRKAVPWRLEQTRREAQERRSCPHSRSRTSRRP